VISFGKRKKKNKKNICEIKNVSYLCTRFEREAKRNREVHLKL